MRASAFIAASLASAIMVGCASRQPDTVMSTEGAILVRTGTVTEVRDITTHGGQSAGTGTTVGAILGGIAGSTLGGGNGSTVASIGGGIAGGLAGRQAEQAANTHAVTQVTVRLDNGEQHVYNVGSGEVFKVGDSVRILSGNSGARLTH